MDLALIGNGSYQAMIDSRARLRLLCWPRFDSDFVVANLLDMDKGGCFSVDGVGRAQRTNQGYIEDTAVLRTRIDGLSGEGDESWAFELIDVAPRIARGQECLRPRHLIRILRPLEGRPSVRVQVQPVVDDARRALPCEADASRLRWLGHEEPIELRASHGLAEIASGQPITLREPLYLLLSWGPADVIDDLGPACETALEETIAYWRQWLGRGELPELFRDAVARSLITLKLHQYDDTGAITASATTSIPEHAGSGRNWDYRFCWPRDGFFSSKALARLGHIEECRGFVSFIERLERLQPLYGIDGELVLEERTLPWLSGYQGDGPVRVGNQAYEQAQHDIYGEILATVDLVCQGPDPDPSLRELVAVLLDAIEANLHAPDAGLWEKRQAPVVHTFSLLMHWYGARAGMRIAASFSDTSLAERALRLGELARKTIEEECWREEPGYFADSTKGSHADASLFMMLTTGFLEPSDPRARRHVDYLARHLSVSGHLLYRYRHDDGIGATLSTFTVCGFWYAEALACLGDLEGCERVVKAILSHANHVGLLSEDIDPESGQLWGNMPQTYSHVGIIECALALQERRKHTSEGD